jgi:hypothetical protein
LEIQAMLFSPSFTPGSPSLLIIFIGHPSYKGLMIFGKVEQIYPFRRKSIFRDAARIMDFSAYIGLMLILHER